MARAACRVAAEGGAACEITRMAAATGTAGLGGGVVKDSMLRLIQGCKDEVITADYGERRDN